MQTPVDEIEAALLQIPGVRAARLVTDDSGKPIEIHVVAGDDKSPKQLVRDIQTVSVANFGIDLDHRIISVVQFPGDDAGTLSLPRPVIEEIATEVRGKAARIMVALRMGDKAAKGESTGANTRDGLLRVAAAATLRALSEMAGNGAWVELEHVGVQRLGSHDVAFTTLNLADAKGVVNLSGSAVVSGLATEAVVRAVLSALNRKLWHDR